MTKKKYQLFSHVVFKNLKTKIKEHYKNLI